MSFSDEIQNEMNECREDERNSQNQIVQVIGTAGAMLGVIFTASIFQNESSSGVKLDPHMLLLLSIAIFSTAFLYITSLGIQNVLRYYYVQWLEDLLADPNESEVKMVHWMSFSSPVTTRNPLHLVNFYAIIHYVCYAGSVLAATVFCMLMIIYQYICLEEKNDYEVFGLIFVVIVIIICVAAFFVTSAKARDMFLYALEKSKVKKKKRLSLLHGQGGNKKKKEMSFVIQYFFYPKKKDIHKSCLILLGYFFGLFLHNEPLRGEHIITAILIWTIIEFLVYSSRYQVNDILGVEEDVKVGKKDRLPIWVLGKQCAVRISGFLVVMKLGLAWYLIKIYPFSEKQPLYFCTIAIIVLTVLYEIARRKQNNVGIFFLVSLGYPLRLVTGIWMAYPDIWVKFPLVLLVLLLISYAFVGEMSVALPWVKEAVSQMKGRKNTNKAHYHYLFQCVSDRRDTEKPLDAPGKITDLWNFSFLIAILCLSISLWLLTQTFLAGTLEIGILLSLIWLCCSGRKESKYFLLLSVACILLRFVLVRGNIENVIWYYFIFLNQLCIIVLYYFLRYYFSVDFDVTKIGKKK